MTKEDEFFSLSHCQLLELISQDSIKVLCESEVREPIFYVLQHGIETGAANSYLREIPRTTVSLLQVYRACTDWVRWDMEGRAQYLHALLNAVHIYALPPKFLKNQLLSCPILSKVNPAVANVLFFFFFSFQSRFYALHSPVLFSRVCLPARPIPARTSCLRSSRI